MFIDCGNIPPQKNVIKICLVIDPFWPNTDCSKAIVSSTVVLCFEFIRKINASCVGSCRKDRLLILFFNKYTYIKEIFSSSS